MASDLGDAAVEAAKRAVKMGSAAADAIAFMADLGRELPFLEPVLKTIRAIREKVETVKRNREELVALEERCTYITACIIEKHSRVPTSEMDVTPLKNCVEAVEAFVELCGRSNRRGRFRRVFKASDDRDEIAGLNARVDRLTGDLQLAGIVTVEGKINNLKALLEATDKSHAARQETILTKLYSLKRRQEEFGERLPKPLAKLAKVPKGTPASKSWHVERHQVMDKAFEALTENGGPRLVGLVGDSGSGKTTAASDIVRSTEAREAFHDGIVWLSINKDANKRLPSLMFQLARMVYEGIGGCVGRPPATSERSTAYIKQRMEEGHVGKGLKCLVVADNVWEKEVVSKLLDTGMWVLLSTREERLVRGEQGEAVGVNELSMADAKSVLRRAAELSPEVDLCDDAVDLIALCGRVAMDLAFVGRWSTVRGRQDRKAWSDAADTVRTEIDKVQAESERNGVEVIHARRRKAILRAGFEDLAVGSDDMRVPRLYLSLAVMPDSHAFTAKEAAVLLCNLAPSAEDVESVERVLETLERWTVLRFTEGTYHMHDAHSKFARESLMDRRYVRVPALERWVRYISSLDALRSIDAFILKELWLAVNRVGGGGWDEAYPYTAALDLVDESDPLLRQTIDAMGCFQEAQEFWEDASKTWCRLLDVEERELGPDHWWVLNTFQALAKCAERLGHVEEAVEWRSKGREALPLALARIQLELDARRVQGSDEACGLYEVGAHISRWAPGHRAEEERLLRAYLATQEAKLDRDDVGVATTLSSLGACVRNAGRLEEAEELLKRCLVIEEDKLGQEDVGVANTLIELGVCIRDAGRPEEAEELFRRCLMINETKLGREHVGVGITLHELGVCVRNTGRMDEAEELLRRCLRIKKATLGKEDLRVATTLHSLGVCVRDEGRLEEANELFRRCLVIKEAKLDPEDVGVAYTLHELGVCVRGAGRLEEAEELLGRCLVIEEATLGREDVGVAITLHELALCVRDAGRLDEGEKLLRRCLGIKEATLGREDLGVTSTLYELGVCVGAAGRLEEAEELLKRCLGIKQAKLGRDDVRVAITLHSLGVCVRNAGRLEEAEELLRRCLAIRESKLGREDVAVSTTLHSLGVCVRNTGRLEEAEDLLRRCLRIKAAKLGRVAVRVENTLYELGVCVRDDGRLEEAEELLRRCLVIQEAKMGGEDVGVATMLHELAACVRDAGRLGDAEDLFRRCLGIKEAKLGREDVTVTTTLYELGICVRDAGRQDEAEALFIRCLGIEEEKLGREDLGVATTLHSLGVCVRGAGRLEEAERLLRRSLVIEEAKLGREDVGVSTTLYELGVCVGDAGRPEEAEELLRRCLAIKEAKLGREDVGVASTLYELGACVGAAGRLEEAELLLRRCLGIKQAKLGREDAGVATTLHELGVCVRRAGRLEEAEELFRRCLDIEEAKLGRENLQVATTFHSLGVCIRKARRLGEAEELLRRCLVIQEAKLGLENMGLASTLYELGVCVRDAGRPEAAEELLRRCLVIQEAKLGLDNVAVAITLYELAVCVRDAGRPEEADELLKRCLVAEEANFSR